MSCLALAVVCLCLVKPAAADVCEGCANPLVEVRPIQFTGDIPESFKKYLQFEGGMERVWAWALFSKSSPCADIQFNLDTGIKDPEIVGPWGDPEYAVESTMNFAKAGADEKTLVIRQSEWDGKEYRKTEPALVPTMGRITVRHELRCLQNNQVYDSATTSHDWIADPPKDEFYAFQEGPAVIDGVSRTPPGGLFMGDFSPRALVDEEIVFSKGDIGTTIRKKETPSSAVIDIDDSSAYPPYYHIRIPEIKNEYGEPMPDGIPVALRVDKGEIEGGLESNGRKMFVTKNSGIPDPIRYRPPKCAALG